MNTTLSSAQGRVLFHQDRLFRSAGGNGRLAHQDYLRACIAQGLPSDVGGFTVLQCRDALQLIEMACKQHGMHRFRDVATGWQQLH